MEQYIQPFVQVSKTVFKGLLNCELVPGRAYFIRKEAFLDWDISGIIALTGEVKGLISISMKSPTASKIAGRLIGEGAGFTEADVVDAIGEIVNIIAGNVKKNLEDMFRIIISLPTVVRGKAHAIVIPEARTRLLCIPFTVFDTDTIWLSLTID
ncbi:MAG: chemotaxis protein CheX [Treponema sp.]|jgi:chemotaxis protein CheX|nr:chemotaxis protein CheX [Treponema sp.]